MLSESNNKSKEHSDFIDSEISKLEYSHWSFGDRIYNEFWNHVKEINILLKETNSLNREDRERLRNRLNSICNDVKIEQNNKFTDEKIKSDSYYEDIMSLIKSSRVCTFFGFDKPDIEEMKRLGSLLKEAGEKLSENKHKMITKHKQLCFSEIMDVRKEHEAWWEDLKKNKNQKRNDFLDRVRENLEKNNEKLRKATQTLEKLKDHREKLNDDIYSAWNDKFKDQAYEWLSDTENKISDIENFIEKLESWISEDEDKIR